MQSHYSFFSVYDPTLYMRDDRIREAFANACVCANLVESISSDIRNKLPWQYLSPLLSELNEVVEELEPLVEEMYDDFAECGLWTIVGGMGENSAHAAALGLARWTLHEIWITAAPSDRWLCRFTLAPVKRKYASVVKHFTSLKPVLMSDDYSRLKTVLKREAIIVAKARAERAQGFEDSIRPLWKDPVLTYRGRKSRYRQPAKNQKLILNSFQELGWPHRIDNPIGQDKRQLGETIEALRTKMKTDKIPIEFQGDGTAKGVIWKLRETSG
jgi:hypothetical protein